MHSCFSGLCFHLELLFCTNLMNFKLQLHLRFFLIRNKSMFEVAFWSPICLIINIYNSYLLLRNSKFLLAVRGFKWIGSHFGDFEFKLEWIHVNHSFESDSNYAPYIPGSSTSCFSCMPDPMTLGTYCSSKYFRKHACFLPDSIKFEWFWRLPF